MFLMHGLAADLQDLCDRLPTPSVSPSVGHVNLFEPVGQGPQSADRGETLGGIVTGSDPGNVVRARLGWRMVVVHGVRLC